MTDDDESFLGKEYEVLFQTSARYLDPYSESVLVQLMNASSPSKNIICSVSSGSASTPGSRVSMVSARWSNIVQGTAESVAPMKPSGDILVS